MLLNGALPKLLGAVFYAVRILIFKLIKTGELMTDFVGSAELRAESLCYEINDKFILNSISFSVKAGEVLFIEGSNGSGKTTLLRILSGLMQADEGEVYWNDTSLVDDHVEFNQQLTYIGHASGIKPELTTTENLHFFSSLSGLPRQQDITDAVHWSGLKGLSESPGRHLSFWQQRRIALTRLMIEPARLWILDEPFSGLDSKMINDLQACFIRHINDGGLLILTSHQQIALDEVNTQRIQLG
jgi:heme exporter protein A